MEKREPQRDNDCGSDAEKREKDREGEGERGRERGRRERECSISILCCFGRNVKATPQYIVLSY